MVVMKLSIVISVLGQHELATTGINLLLENRAFSDTEVVIIDNGGDYSVFDGRHEENIWMVRPDKNVGVYPTFKLGMETTESEIVAFFHSDLMVVEKGFDKRILDQFEMFSKLGLVGFVGSNEIDAAGGRGNGTTSNFQGAQYFSGIMNEGRTWTGSPAEAHGKRNDDYTKAAVVDGCAMVIRRTAWEKIGYRKDFPPHHFYDRLISTQMLEAGYNVAVLGIACDHISGQTVGGQSYVDFAEEWSRKNLPESKWVGNPPHYAWDQTVYQEAERQWLSQYRDKKHLIPIRV